LKENIFKPIFVASTSVLQTFSSKVQDGSLSKRKTNERMSTDGMSSDGKHYVGDFGDDNEDAFKGGEPNNLELTGRIDVEQVGLFPVDLQSISFKVNLQPTQPADNFDVHDSCPDAPADRVGEDAGLSVPIGDASNLSFPTR
jgi:hypothetical protein